jgi:hypothetical protein
MYGTPRRSTNYFYTSNIPVTITLLAANVLSFFFVASLPGGGPFQYLLFRSDAWPARFWTLFTWPLVGAGDPLGLIFALGWGFLFGGSLERAWGTRTFLWFLLGVSGLTALTVWAGSLLLQTDALLAGLWVAMAAPAVAWSVINARETMSLFFLPIPAPWMAAVAMAIAWYHTGPPFLGLFALSGCAAAYWYARHGRDALGGYGRPRRSSGGEPPLRFRDFDREPAPRRGGGIKRWLDDRRQRRELEKLLRRSGFSDPDENRRR